MPENTARRSKDEHRLNMNMTYWAHRKLRVIAAEDMTTMRHVIESAILGFEELDETDRDILYVQAHELQDAEQQAAKKAKAAADKK